MKILHVSEHLYRSSGVSVFCAEICDRLADSGHDVRLALQWPDFHDPYPVRHTEMLVSVDEVIRDFPNANWDVVHINGVWNPPYHRIAAVATKNHVPIVWSPHGSLTKWALAHKRFKKFVAWHLYQKRDLRLASRIHVTAQDEMSDMRRLGLKNEVVVVPLGVDLCFGDEEISRIKTSKKTRKVLFLSRVHPKKGIDNLIRAWAEIKNKTPELTSGWSVEIAGECNCDGYLDYLRTLAVKCGVEKECSFVGALYGEAKGKAYAESELFVLPSYSENFGSVVVEALSNGTPVITTKGTPWEELTANGCGWWIDIGTDVLTSTLRAALALSDDERRKMGENGRKLVKSKYTWASVVSKFEKTYQSMSIDRK